MPSNVPGYLSPASSPAPLEDDALDDFLGDVVAGITLLDRDNLIRPRWQEDPPALPDRDVTWCAIGVTGHDPDTYAYVQLEADGTSQDITRHETLTINATFYGPLSAAFATLFRDGLQIDQNREALMLAGFGLLSATGPTQAPELVKERWLGRNDIIWTTRREIRRNYPVLSLLSAHGTLYSDHVVAPFDTLLPP